MAYCCVTQRAQHLIFLCSLKKSLVFIDTQSSDTSACHILSLLIPCALLWVAVSYFSKYRCCNEEMACYYPWILFWHRSWLVWFGFFFFYLRKRPGICPLKVLLQSNSAVQGKSGDERTKRNGCLTVPKENCFLIMSSSLFT